MCNMRRGRPPLPPEEKQPLPPLLHGYWQTADLKDRVERHIVEQQAAGRLPIKTPRGQRYWVIHFVMDAIKEKLLRDGQKKKS